MFDRLEDIVKHYEEIMFELSNPSVTENQKKFRALMKEQADLTPLVETYKEYVKAKQTVEDSLLLLEEESDEEMRELAKEVPVIDDILSYTVGLISATHPEIEGASDTAKKYVKYGASPRAAQALITCAKVRALINGNFNVSYEDIDALAYPVLRHRIKINYTAVNEKLTCDDVIAMLIKENKKTYKK